MKRSRVGFLRLISELENDIESLDDLMAKYFLINKKIKQIEPDEFDWASLGYVIHNIYNQLENYFLRISKYFENDLDDTSWHKDLVNRMTIEIKDIRPKLLDRALANNMNELRAFRHVFRYIYQSELDEKKLKDLNKQVPTIINRFKDCHKLFLETLQKISIAL